MARDDAALSVHRLHIHYIYLLRALALFIALLFSIAGIVGVFMGLQGSFDWAFTAPSDLGAKLTNASPGVILLVAGFFLAWRIGIQRPVNFRTGGRGLGGSQSITLGEN